MLTYASVKLILLLLCNLEFLLVNKPRSVTLVLMCFARNVLLHIPMTGTAHI